MHSSIQPYPLQSYFQGMPLGLYLHVPFCATACSFCAFYQERPQRSALEAYLEGIEEELKHLSFDRSISTLFWGGGTPGLLPADDLLRLGHAVRKAIGPTFSEWTVELAPSVVKPDKLKALQDLGVTRLSMGVQSFKPALLEALGRRQGPKQIYQAYEWMRDAGFSNINIDLMFALPGQSFEDWQEDLHMAIALNPEHISTYCLTFEEDTALYSKLIKGTTHRRSLEEEALFYLKTWEKLGHAGYEQYEISNFSRKGYACQHNLDTWSMAQWIGIGPSAASQYQGLRYQNPASIETWLKVLKKENPIREDLVYLTPEDLLADSLIFGLRLNTGIDLKKLTKRFPFISNQPSLSSLWNDLEKEGLLHTQSESIFLSDQGRLIADAIGLRILESCLN